MTINTGGRATVRVRMEVEVTVGVWNATETFEGLAQQASKEAVQKLTNNLQKGSISKDVRIIGEPTSMHVVLVSNINGR